MRGRSRATGASRNSAPAATSLGRCTRVGKCKRWQSPSRVARSRPLPCSVRRISDFVPSGPRHCRSRRGTLLRGCCHGELVRTLSCSPQVSCGALCPIPPRYTRPAEDRCVLIREHLRECRAAGEVLKENLCQLGMRDTDLFAPDSRRTSNRGVLKGVPKRVPPTIPVAPTITRFFWPAIRTFISDSEALIEPAWFFVVMRVRAPSTPRRGAGAP
jgi:hypothetical protein